MKKFIFTLLFLFFSFSTGSFAAEKIISRVELENIMFVNPGVPALILSTTINIPVNPKPRVAISHYNLVVSAGAGSNIACETWVDDQQLINFRFADTNHFLQAGGTGGFNGSGISKNIYSSGQTITFSLWLICFNDTVGIYPNFGVSSNSKTHLELIIEIN